MIPARSLGFAMAARIAVFVLVSTHLVGVVIAGSSNRGMGPWGVSVVGPNRYESISSRSLWNPAPNGRTTTSKEIGIRKNPELSSPMLLHGVPRGGYESSSRSSFTNPSPSSTFVRVVGTIAQALISAGRIVLPTLAGALVAIIKFYRALPIDAITAQIGLVYCFLGGYYPTFFSTLQAARYCGLDVMLEAVGQLTDEAIKVVDEIERTDFWDDVDREPTAREVFLRKANIVLKTVDPVRINQATAALYTTWLGVSTVLRREYARTISLSLTLAEGLERAAEVVLVPALNVLTPSDYRKWVPAVIGWSAKAAAMRLVWRIERILTASTSALAGGAMFSRSVWSMVRKHREKKTLAIENKSHNSSEYDEEEDSEDEYEPPSIGENVVGFAVGGLGFYTQMECQYKKAFSFEVPFPLSLVTWPFDLAERWIQWYITSY